MMAKAPAQRYQTPAEVAEALAAWTTMSIPPPPEEEMPRLSPAVAPAPSSTTPTAKAPARVARTPSTPARAVAVVSARTDGNARRLDLAPAQRLPASAQQETPRALASTTPIETDRPRNAAEPVRPSRRLAALLGARRRQSLRLAVILLCGAVAGIALRFALMW
jgi:hypothetical protein